MLRFWSSWESWLVTEWWLELLSAGCVYIGFVCRRFVLALTFRREKKEEKAKPVLSTVTMISEVEKRCWWSGWVWVALSVLSLSGVVAGLVIRNRELRSSGFRAFMLKLRGWKQRKKVGSSVD
ncbi:MAG: hypothetical protein ACKERG_03910 [Candidatus Hodgkinia cicadicola]